MKRVILFLMVGILSFSIIGCTQKEEEVIKMGFVPLIDGDKLVESVEPLADMLTEEIGVKVEGFTATNYVGVVEGLGSGQVDFGIIPPFAYVLANEESNAEVILTAVDDKGEAQYQSEFLVRKDSGIESFEDVKGKIVAFVDPSSTSGYLFPGAHLINEGIDIEEDIEYMYSGGHDKSIQLLLNGDVDVIASFTDIRERYLDEFPEALEETEILGHTDNIPFISVTTKADMDPELQEKIQNALLKLGETEEGRQLLPELFNIHGFVKATDEDYEIIRTTAETMNVDLKDSQ